MIAQDLFSTFLYSMLCPYTIEYEWKQVSRRPIFFFFFNFHLVEAGYWNKNKLNSWAGNSLTIFLSLCWVSLCLLSILCIYSQQSTVRIWGAPGLSRSFPRSNEQRIEGRAEQWLSPCQERRSSTLALNHSLLGPASNQLCNFRKLVY